MSHCPHEQTPAHASSRATATPSAQQIFIQITPKQEQQKQSQLSKVTLWHEVCFAPNACLAYFDSPLNYFISSLLYSTPSSSPTCLTNWPGECLLRRYFLNQLKVIWQKRVTVNCSTGLGSKQIQRHRIAPPTPPPHTAPISRRCVSLTSDVTPPVVSVCCLLFVRKRAWLQPDKLYLPVGRRPKGDKALRSRGWVFSHHRPSGSTLLWMAFCLPLQKAE